MPLNFSQPLQSYFVAPPLPKMFRPQEQAFLMHWSREFTRLLAHGGDKHLFRCQFHLAYVIEFPVARGIDEDAYEYSYRVDRHVWLLRRGLTWGLRVLSLVESKKGLYVQRNPLSMWTFSIGPPGERPRPRPLKRQIRERISPYPPRAVTTTPPPPTVPPPSPASSILSAGSLSTTSVDVNDFTSLSSNLSDVSSPFMGDSSSFDGDTSSFDGDLSSPATSVTYLDSDGVNAAVDDDDVVKTVAVEAASGHDDPTFSESLLDKYIRDCREEARLRRLRALTPEPQAVVVSRSPSYSPGAWGPYCG
ncbi:hypothetical protein BDZ89DRAFT_1152146 [Hymenopellis radicata]|nr:hypothetical protein BDZ89DRAFT_1152146 [Hymenopellis radicata]